jgi:hypothetical protein
MGSVVVTVTDGRGSERDVELPSDIPLRVLAPNLARAIGHPDVPADGMPVKYVIKQTATGEVLPPDRTLEGCGIVHADILLLMVKPIPAPLVRAETSVTFSGPGLVHRSGKTFRFRGKTILVGRADPKAGLPHSVLGVDLTELDDAETPSVSRRHAKVLLQRGRWQVEDLESTNGTAVDGRWLQAHERAVLDDGSTVQFGDVVLAFVWESQEGGAQAS